MFRIITDALLLPAGTIVAMLVPEGHAAFPVYQLIVSLIAMAVIGILLLYGACVWRDLNG